MKRRLLFGHGIIALIFVLSGIFVVSNLHIITSGEKLRDGQDAILDRCAAMIEDIKSAQVELYRHQAGYSRNIDSLVEDVLHFEDSLSLTEKEYGALLNQETCNRCHPAQGKLETLGKKLGETRNHLKTYKSAISLILSSKDRGEAGRLEKTAAYEGEAILGIMDNVRHASLKMNEKTEEMLIGSIIRSRYSIIAAVVLGILLSGVTAFLLIKSVTGRIDMLVRGVEKVSSGDYRSRVDIASADEIGFLAETFNAMTGNLAEMTEKKETLLAELKELNSHLEDRVREATAQLEAAHEKVLRSETLSAVGTFASGVAHELATPLSSVLSYFQTVKGKIPAEDRLVADIALIEGELMRCRTILRGMLDFARPPETEKSVTNINEIISELLALVAYQTEYRNVTKVPQLTEGLPDIMAIPGQLRQVFLNIILNALQSMPGGGTLTVSTFLTGDGYGGRVAVRVSDTGPGIPEDEINRIFQPFYTTKESGTGLGLSISYGIIRGHGGDIEVKSEVGKGTTFSVYLPVSPHISHDAAGVDEDQKRAGRRT